MTTSERSPRPVRSRTPSLGDAWLQAPCPVLVVDPAGTVVAANARATALFPGATGGTWLPDVVPDWLARAHRTVVAGGEGSPTGPVRGPHGPDILEAHATHGPDGTVVWWPSVVTDRSRARAALRSERERNAFLTDASTQLLASLNLERCMEATVRLAAEHLADAAVLVAPSPGKRHRLTLAAGDAVAHGSVRIDPATVPGLAEALRGFPPLPSRWIDPALLPGWALPDGFTGPVGSVAITPLPGPGFPAGALILLRRGDRAAFDSFEEQFARVFASRAGAALSAARMYREQSEITTTLMAELLPPELRHVHGVEFAGGYRAAQDTDRVGGDFYEVHPGAGPQDETLAVLGDVCGKGLDAAVLTGKIRNTLHALLPMADDHQRVLTLLNGALLGSRHTRFASLVLASVRRRGDTTHLRLTCAGHPAPLIVRHDGTVHEARTRGTIVGVLPEVTSTTAEVELRPGESCLLFTDGVTEARGGPLGEVMFDDERLRAALCECAGMPAEAIVERVQLRVAEWLDDQPHDDIAVMAITAPHLPAPEGRGTSGKDVRPTA
ncbi:serine/threonine protein phosphatase [Streptomyces sp. WAC05458]|uniref:PP2C family protein-serine/threonine phosphatase n=1 Tax=Streptomyces sp. WAC05458 TaxID=2487412 RepID=UPI000FBB0859|nr:SpoIIE family protein phosphatase [Streptomyces sp. WAC05458]RSS22456.1 serine/threonine protein phosphatase [Streptomyces sp. WAC05458]